ncbi:hypothetical protein SBOR_6096 [Sclerotinia borealis F-4128]|uniref:Phosphatidylinositol-specific phospholipase C X domain-containing protein n=1 Tax=Sclerotinia borealis (strain F-4128) TaxID=1432307 RepID=W9CG36_SCLBF|nr:hypothetical protein SBOR_6096 [Sclerotinia borealis F-4128]
MKYLNTGAGDMLVSSSLLPPSQLSTASSSLDASSTEEIQRHMQSHQPRRKVSANLLTKRPPSHNPITEDKDCRRLTSGVSDSVSKFRGTGNASSEKKRYPDLCIILVIFVGTSLQNLCSQGNRTTKGPQGKCLVLGGMGRRKSTSVNKSSWSHPFLDQTSDQTSTFSTLPTTSPSIAKSIAPIAMFVSIVSILIVFGALIRVHASPISEYRHVNSSDVSIQEFALQKLLKSASPIFGNYANNQLNTSTWMSKYLDSTKLVHMNIPGTHDTATWNYSLATQSSLSGITSFGNAAPSSPETYRCQSKSIIDMLDAGIRAFDLRFALDVTNTSIVFWHSQALLSQTATLDDVLFGYYHWLDNHPSEVVLLSLQYEGSTTEYGSNDAEAQLKLFNILTSPAATQYLVQRKDDLGTVGEARGKIILLRRFDLDHLPNTYENTLPGLHLSPALWTDNSPDIRIIYNAAAHITAYIEDYYEPETPSQSNATLNIQWKYNATTTHLLKAADKSLAPDSLWWTWASGGQISDGVSPEIMAVGNGTAYTPTGGINQKLVTFLKGMEGKRVGIVMFDFFETPGNLVETLLSL